MFDVSNWVAHLNGENGPGYPPYLVSDHFSTPRVVAKSHKRYEEHRPSPQDHSI